MHEQVAAMGVVDKPFESGRIVGGEAIAAAPSDPIRPFLMQFDDLHPVAAVFLKSREIRVVNGTMRQGRIFVVVVPNLAGPVIHQHLLLQAGDEVFANPFQILQSLVTHKVARVGWLAKIRFDENRGPGKANDIVR
jgi:hypothetical protein